MASSCRGFVGRTSLTSLRSAFKSTTSSPAPTFRSATAPSPQRFPLPSTSSSSVPRRFSLSRVPSELGCVQSLLPLHSAVAVARMTSCLSASSCRALSQGT